MISLKVKNDNPVKITKTTQEVILNGEASSEAITVSWLFAAQINTKANVVATHVQKPVIISHLIPTISPKTAAPVSSQQHREQRICWRDGLDSSMLLQFHHS